MKHAIQLFQITALLVAGSALAAPSGTLIEIAKPTGVKVRAAFNKWESYLNPNLCFPDGVAYQVAPPTDGRWEDLTLKAAMQTSQDVEKLTAFESLTTESDVRAAGDKLLVKMGMVADPAFNDRLVRVFQRREKRLLFFVETDGSAQLEGRFIAIADLENHELVLLTDGDAFGVSRCEE